MTRDQINAFCAALPQSTHVVQWGSSDVWKIGGKVFAIVGYLDNHPTVTFKVTRFGFEVLGDMPGVRPAPYLASRGMKWLQNYQLPGLSDDDLQAHIRVSYEMIAQALTGKKRAELGLLPPP